MESILLYHYILIFILPSDEVKSTYMRLQSGHVLAHHPQGYHNHQNEAIGIHRTMFQIKALSSVKYNNVY